MKQKYFKTLKEAKQAHSEAVKRDRALSIYKMPKGSRKSGWYIVCSHMEYLNTY